MSPFFCEGSELCDRMGGSLARRTILRGLYALRRDLVGLGVTGFQWLGGSFVEDIEAQEGRDPNDVDVVTFVADPRAPAALDLRLRESPLRLLDRKHVKKTYKVDHFVVSLGSQPRQIVQESKRWFGLFSHRRDRVWKGMLALPLNTADDNDAVLSKLDGAA